MRAADVMTTSVIAVKPDMTVREVARIFVERKISGAPVVDAAGRLIGMVSEGDLIHRVEIGTEQRRRSSWLELFSTNDGRARLRQIARLACAGHHVDPGRLRRRRHAAR